MAPKPIAAQSQITFLYYRDLETAARFYEQTMRFELVEDQQWAKIYRVAGTAFVGIVAGDKGFRRPQEYNAVLLTILVNDVYSWYAYLQELGGKFLTEVQDKPDIQVRCFFIEDPGGYAIEIQQFLRPDLVKIFHSD
jgi:predicted enzyme related to lactoylglutathione lyase